MADAFKKMEDDILEKELRHDETVIDRKRTDINEHEEQIEKDSSKFMKKLHEDEIKHDEKVIERREHAADKHEDKIKDNEQDIAAK